MFRKITLGLTLVVSAIFLSSDSVHAMTISTPQTYDCGNATLGNLVIKNTHDVIIKNCKIAVTNEQGIQIIDSYNVTMNHIDISSSYPEGSGVNIVATHVRDSKGNETDVCITPIPTYNITLDDFNIHGPMGWGVSGSYCPLKNITVKNGTFDSIGQGGGEEKHGMYIENWQGVGTSSLIENVTVKNSWNSGIKIVGATNNLTINKVYVSNSGRYGGTSYPSSGPAISLGDGRGSDDIKNIVISNSVFTGNPAPAIWTTQETRPITNVTVDHNTFYNNYFAVEIPKNGTGWKVTNNIGYTDASYAPSKVVLQLDGPESDIPNNLFKNNLWYFKNGSGVSDPIRVGGKFASLSVWQKKTGGPDVGSVSVDPKFVSLSDFHLQPSSPACLSGEGGSYIGAYPCTTTATALPSPILKIGDANSSNTVDEADFNIWKSSFLNLPTALGYANGNFDNNSIVDGVDYMLWVNNYGR